MQETLNLDQTPPLHKTSVSGSTSDKDWTGNKCAMFLKIQFLEGKARKKLFTKYPPKKIYVSSSRLLCAKNADFDGMKAGGGSAVAYAWFIWEKGFQGQTTIEWFN